MLLATAYLFIAYGRNAYFVAFHKPFHLVAFHNQPVVYTPPALPSFEVASSIAHASLSPGGTQVITVAETPDRNVQGFIQVWIQSPANVSGPTNCQAATCNLRNVYQNDTDGPPIQFIKGKAAVFTYTYKLPDNLRAGTYSVSDIITSKDRFTDYYVHNDFAEFTVR